MEDVDYEQFTIEIKVKENLLQVTLNNEDTFVFDDIHVEKWGVFENYFKAGNYLETSNSGIFSEVKYYQLKVTH